MTLNELIERLEEYRDLHGEDCEVRLMTQQNWPFENTITGLASGAEINESDDDDYDDEDVERTRWSTSSKVRSSDTDRSEPGRPLTNAETPAGVVRRWFAGPDDGSHPLHSNVETTR
jgi:hypothetical protein